jgi:hypothetical protein
MSREFSNGRETWVTVSDAPEAARLLDEVLAATELRTAPPWLPAAQALVRRHSGTITPEVAAGVVATALADWFLSTAMDKVQQRNLSLRIADTLLNDDAVRPRFLAFWARLSQS